MINRGTFAALGKGYGTVASWAVWAEPKGRRAGEWVSDLSALDPGLLHDRAVMIALNSGVREKERDRPTWGMFHDPVGRDFMLADAVRDTPFWGCYLTDFFKGLPTRDGSGLRALLRTQPGLEQAAGDDLRRELAVLTRTKPLLVCLGRQVAPYVTAHFGETHRIAVVSHYSRAMTKVSYRAEFETLVRAVNERNN